jgi:hypothetical protein
VIHVIDKGDAPRRECCCLKGDVAVNPLQKTLAILALLIISAQTVRHAYLLWLEPRGSVLDKYDQPLKDQISGATSLEELLRRYDQVRKQIDLAKQEAAKAGKEVSDRYLAQLEPYKSEHALRYAISDWEGKSKEIRALGFYWFIGFTFLVLGAFTYRKLNRWLGLTLLIAGFSEFIYWTSPTFLGTTREFDRLLENKFVFSLLSLMLLMVVIWFLRIFSDESQPA